MFYIKIVQNEKNRTLESAIGFYGSTGVFYAFKEPIYKGKKHFLVLDPRYESEYKKKLSTVEVINLEEEKSLLKKISGYIPILDKHNTRYKSLGNKHVFFEQPPEKEVFDIIEFKDLTSENVDSKILRIPSMYFTQDWAEICWLLNIRTKNPFFNVKLYIVNGKVFCNNKQILKHHKFIKSSSILNCKEKYFCDHSKTNVQEALKTIKTRPIKSIDDILEVLSKTSKRDIIMSKRFNFEHIDSPVDKVKAIKNKLEIAGFKVAHLIDGLAIKSLKKILDQKPNLSEIEISNEAFQCRRNAVEFLMKKVFSTQESENKITKKNDSESISIKKDIEPQETFNQSGFLSKKMSITKDLLASKNKNVQLFFDKPVITILKIISKLQKDEILLRPSFKTIAGLDENGANIHHMPGDKKNGSVLLLDSGGQYICGTTDVTRVFILKNECVDDKVKSDYTDVLKAHIAFDKLIFPEKTPGAAIDAIARTHLWKKHKDYAHSTGHGVGHCLNVHEGPQFVSPASLYPISEGMVMSNEPGYYDETSHGIRIESLVYTVKSQKANPVQFLKFETLTLCPLEERLIKYDELSSSEKKWVQNYNENIKDILSFIEDL